MSQIVVVGVFALLNGDARCRIKERENISRKLKSRRKKTDLWANNGIQSSQCFFSILKLTCIISLSVRLISGVCVRSGRSLMTKGLGWGIPNSYQRKYQRRSGSKETKCLKLVTG